MPITERTLKRWRSAALKSLGTDTITIYKGIADGLAYTYTESQKRILRMTQELLDQHLLRKK